MPQSPETHVQTSEPKNQGSNTITITESATPVDSAQDIVRLTVEGEARESRGPRVRWDSEVIDNEGMNKKKSKVCCIFKKERAVGESSSEDESSSGEEYEYQGNRIGSPNNYERVGKRKGHSHNCKKR
ncbi:hypothetical protein K502DRAFT_364521 [Neoconidiobolus thromboides FSU 785]|nr:hypothetical protein K502DRAFT_364521 [Neoconidiobolus thromboides FSU 785]